MYFNLLTKRLPIYTELFLQEFVGREEKTLILSVELVHQELKPSVQKMVNEYLKTETLTDENML